MFNYRELRQYLADKDSPLPTYYTQRGGYQPTPRLEPASKQIGRELGDAFAPDSSLWERGSSLFGAATGIFGLPQEGVTRLLSGGQAGLPSETPFVQNILGMLGGEGTDSGAFLANLILDPLHLAFGGLAARELSVGRLRETATFGRIEGGFNQLQLLEKQGFLFKKKEDAQRLLKSSGLDLHVIQDKDTLLYTYNFQGLNPDRYLPQLQRAKQEFGITEFALLDEADPLLAGGDLIAEGVARGKAFAIRKSDLEGSSLTPAKPHFLFGLRALGGSPRNHSPAMKAVVSTLEDTEVARFGFADQLSTQVKELLTPHGLLVKGAGRRPLGRALTYAIMEDDGLKGLDAAAQQAVKDFGEGNFQKLKSQVQYSILGAMKRLPPGVRIRGVEGVAQPRQLGRILDELFENIDLDDVNLPPMPIIGAYLRQRRGLGVKKGLTNLTPNNVDLHDFLNYFVLSISKHAFVDPTVKQLKGLVGSDARPGSIKGMSRAERHLARALLDTAEGKPQFSDLLMTSGVSQMGDFVRGLIMGEKAEDIKAGKSVIADEEGWRGAAARKVETLIARAERGEPLASELSVSARNVIYSSMLGLAVDSGVRNLTQTLNTITEFGVQDTIRAMGGKFTKEWSDFLKTSKVLDRTSSQLVEFYERVSFTERSKFIEHVMTPMMIAENFNRGVSFMAAMNRATQKGLPLALAIEEAIDTTRKLQFGYSLLDISPFWRDPLIRPFFQFMSYPLKQLELLAEWATEPSSLLRNKAVKYFVTVGAAGRYANHLGLSIERVVLGGFMPIPLFQEGHPQAPLYQGMSDAMSGVSNLFNFAVGKASGKPETSMSELTRGLVDMIKLITPGGRYLTKVTGEALEAGVADGLAEFLFGGKNTQQVVASNPIVNALVEDGLRVDFDPGVDGFDRWTRLAGFSSIRDIRRKDFIEFMGGFIRDYRTAVSEINTAAALGTDWEPTRDRWVFELKHKYGPRMEEYGVRDYVVYHHLRPSPPKRLKRKAELRGATSEQRIISTFPKDILRAIEGGMP